MPTRSSGEPIDGLASHFALSGRRHQNVSTTAVDSCGLAWTGVHDSEERNPLRTKRFSPEVTRHQ